MSMESSQSKNERDERERGGDEKYPPPSSPKKGLCGVYVCSVFLECRIALCSLPVKTVDAHLGEV